MTKALIHIVIQIRVGKSYYKKGTLSERVKKIKITALLLTNSLLNEPYNSLNKACNLVPVLPR